ncbi:hypothetical protein [Rubellicoccus peritrichatus]|uniref:Uncharacterized protein n=1 Tax=Rubellicoccus peritrichatus TaxID=3080537 RepID=A0AAQ3L5Q9_9BACT|nr:hypothetical protein [Puniceicoccus sp. CR14]WOO39710.1 hypothetical protein RZN69_13890 [Puniceicoccus sp. CR14]
MNEAMSEQYWKSRARFLALGVNFAWCWQRFLPVIVVLNLIFSAFLLVARRAEWGLSTALWIYLGCLILSSIIAFLMARGRFFTEREALLRLETAMGLKNRLTAAASGAISWPKPMKVSGSAVGIRLRPLVLPLAVSLVFLMLGLWMPIRSAPNTVDHGTMAEPTAWKEVAEWAEIIREERLIDPKAAEVLEEQLDELRDLPANEWYKQGSLEAGESLREETRIAMQALARRMQSTSAFLEEMSKGTAGMSTAQLESLDKAWANQLQQLEMSQLAIDPQTLAQLKNLSFKNLQQLSAEDLKNMCEQFKQCAGSCAGAASLAELDLEKITLKIQQMCSGINRGPGPAPLILKDEGTDLATAEREGVSNQDLRNATLGETVAVSSRPGNEDEKTFSGSQRIDDTAQAGIGGDAVWRESFTPQEREALQRYFK